MIDLLAAMVCSSAASAAAAYVGRGHLDRRRAAEAEAIRRRAAAAASRRLAQMEKKDQEDHDLALAIDQARVITYFQPIVSAQNGGIVSFEALVRMKSTDGKMIPPGEFIPYYEANGGIIQLGREVLRQACAEAVKWPSCTRVAVNVSVRQFEYSGLIADIKAALAESGLPANRLEIELTESIAAGEHDEVERKLHEIRALGVHTALDDFGTGYSSLTYLRKFPFNKIKIDQCFVREVLNSNETAVIVRAVSYMSKALNASTVAEGVENYETFSACRCKGITNIQGYYISKPVPADMIPKLFETYGTHLTPCHPVLSRPNAR